ncbi:LAGLIDADG family homing endonuclease [Streptomyces sp. NPDC001774]
MADQDPNAPALFDISDCATESPAPFMDLENPRYAYMFGFLQADGHLAAGSGQKGKLTVEINVRDIAMLREFQALTPYSSSITERTRSTNFAETHHSATWTLCSLEARTVINQLGLPYGRKSKRITPPLVPFSRPDYLRGIIDADGSVGFTAGGLPFVSLTTASTAIAVYLCHYTKRALGIQRLPGRNKRDGTYNVVYAREAGVTLAQHLYTPDALALARKKAAAADVTAWVRPADMAPARTRRSWTLVEDRILLDAETLGEAAVKLGRSRTSCQLRRMRLLKRG